MLNQVKWRCSEPVTAPELFSLLLAGRKYRQEVLLRYLSGSFGFERVEQKIIPMHHLLIFREEAEHFRTDYKPGRKLLNQGDPIHIQDPTWRNLLVEDNPRQIDHKIGMVGEHAPEYLSMIWNY